MGYSAGIKIDPNATYIFGKSRREVMAYDHQFGGVESLVAEVIGVGFDDGTTWGESPEPPQFMNRMELPPPPPQGAPGRIGPPPEVPRFNLPVGPGLSGPDSAGRPGLTGERPPRMRGPMQIEDGVEPPVMLNRASAEYTEQARKNNTEGTVDLRVLVDKSGAVKFLRIVKGLPDGLNQSAEKAVKQLRFKPATKNGEPVEYEVTLAVEFYNN
jgi:protein TonB